MESKTSKRFSKSAKKVCIQAMHCMSEAYMEGDYEEALDFLNLLKAIDPKDHKLNIKLDNLIRMCRAKMV
jgi:hypothetical protein